MLRSNCTHRNGWANNSTKHIRQTGIPHPTKIRNIHNTLLHHNRMFCMWTLVLSCVGLWAVICWWTENQLCKIGVWSVNCIIYGERLLHLPRTWSLTARNELWFLTGRQNQPLAALPSGLGGPGGLAGGLGRGEWAGGGRVWVWAGWGDPPSIWLLSFRFSFFGFRFPVSGFRFWG